MRKQISFASFFILLAVLVVAISSVAMADGTETLGPPSVTIASGSGIVAAGVGLQAQPGVINLDVPGTVVQALLYWGGAVTSNSASDDTILVDGAPVTGTNIGGQAFFFSSSGKSFYYTNYRADVTSLVNSGLNSFVISGLENIDVDGHGENSGAGLLVIFDDGSGTSAIVLKDGLDLAYAGFPEPRQTTVPQLFSFAPAPTDRIAKLVIFAGSVGQETRTSTIVLSTDVGDLPDEFNVLGSVDGDLWDTLTLDVLIPANASSLTVRVLSGDGGGNPASLNWVGAGLSVPPPPPPPAGEGCTPGYWKNPKRLEEWTVAGTNPDADFDSTFGVDFFDPDITLFEAVGQGGGGVNVVARHGTAALLSARHPEVDYPLSEAEVIAAVQAQNADLLVGFNELEAPGFCD